MRNARPRSLLAFLLACILGAAFALGAPVQSEAAQKKPLATLSLTLNNPIFNPGLAFLWIPEYLGWNAKEGFKMQWKVSSGGVQGLTWVSRGVATFGVPSPEPILLAAARGVDLGVKAVYTYSRKPIYSLAVLPNSPIRRWKDLAGKKVGILSFADVANYYVRAGAKQAGIDPASISFLPVGAAGQAVGAMRAGQVDAICIADVQYGLVEARGIKLRYLPAPKVANSLYGNTVFVRDKFIKDHPKLIVGFLRGLAKASIFYRENPKAALQIHWKLFPASKPKGMSDKEAFRTFLTVIKWRMKVLKPAKGGVWGKMSKSAWEAFLPYLGIQGKVKDVSKFYTNKFIAQANDFDHAAVRKFARNFNFEKFERERAKRKM